jgi:hypothetical protein
MPRTSRKVELVAAGLYALSFVVWTLSDDYGAAELEAELKPTIYINQAPGLTAWEVSSLALLVVAVALTVAAVRLRRSERHDS